MLARALESAAAQCLPEDISWEVLVVDNNSSDQTRAIAESFCQRFPGRFRYLFEPQQGLSRARNAGIQSARGEVIAFMDDDVMVAPAWLANLTATLHSGEWAGAGGPVRPPEDFKPPRWLALGGAIDMGGALALIDFGERSGELKAAPYGANMAFRKEMFRRYGMFRVDLGRCGDNLLSNEDTEFGNRLLAGGERLWYAASAVVHHPVQEKRLCAEYYRGWWFNFGRARVLERGFGKAILGIPRQYVSLLSLITRILPKYWLEWMFTFGTQQRFYKKCRLWLAMGEVSQTYQHCIELGKPGSPLGAESSGQS